MLNPLIGVSAFIGRKMNPFKGEKFSLNEKIKLQQTLNPKNGKLLIFANNSMNDDYDVNSSEYLYGLFDDFTFPSIAFETILKSKGGSELNIIEKKFIPSNFVHLNKGHFNEGLYIVHPKNENILIPLNSSNKLIQTLILEETVRAYEALGAKRIIINDITKHDVKSKVSAKKVEANANLLNEESLLRDKEFGKGVFCPDRAMSDKYFIQDIPSVMSTIEGRIEGNQLTESFKETVNLGIGLDVNVLNLYKGGLKYNYLREWSFKVEFYDKNEITE